MLFRDPLEIRRVVVRREGVLLPAEFGDGLGELALRMGRGTLEHQVFEEMRDAGLADRVIGRPVAVPDHVRDDRRAMIRDHDDLEAVVETTHG